jgi:hypothetical protein
LLRGWTQKQAAEHLKSHLGESWSEAVFSAAERSVTGKRPREFTANDLYAFSVAFDLPIPYFLMPPPPRQDVTTFQVSTPAGTDSPGALLERLFGLDEPTRKRLRKASEMLLPNERTAKQNELLQRTEGYMRALLEPKLGELTRHQQELAKVADSLEELKRVTIAEAKSASLREASE